MDVRELLISTKVNSVSQSDINEAKELIQAGLNKLG
jgi:hypothetical protein